MEGIINIAGAMPRIGTTTAAIQLAVFLRESGYESAYVEMNNQNYIWACKELYSGCEEDQAQGKTVYNGVEMFPGNRLEELVSGGSKYDYVICDYGRITSDEFNKTNFLNGSACILTVGIGPSEIFSTEKAMRSDDYDDVIWLYNFTVPEEKEDILDMMGGRSTCFMEYVPDAFKREISGDAEACYVDIMDNVVGRIGTNG